MANIGGASTAKLLASAIGKGVYAALIEGVLSCILMGFSMGFFLLCYLTRRLESSRHFGGGAYADRATGTPACIHMADILPSSLF